MEVLARASATHTPVVDTSTCPHARRPRHTGRPAVNATDLDDLLDQYTQQLTNTGNLDTEGDAQMAGNVLPVENREAAIIALARGATTDQAAAEAGVTSRTVRRWLADPAVSAEVRRLRADLLNQVVGALSDAAVDAVHTLRDALGADSENVRVRAAQTILTALVSLRDATEVTERLTAIEDALNAHQSAHRSRTQIGVAR